MSNEYKPESASTVRVVFRGLDTDCSAGLCRTGCSHRMWSCGRCSSEGGWGSPVSELQKMADSHECSDIPEAAPSDTDRKHSAICVAWSDPNDLECICDPEPSDTDPEALEGVIEEAEGRYDDMSAIGKPPGSVVPSFERFLADAILAAGWTRSQPVQVEVTEASVKILAKHMANAASDWNHDDCDDDDHSLEHSNWEAYTGDALRALSAALTPPPAVPVPEVIPGTRAVLDGLGIRTGGGDQ